MSKTNGVCLPENVIGRLMFMTGVMEEAGFPKLAAQMKLDIDYLAKEQEDNKELIAELKVRLADAEVDRLL